MVQSVIINPNNTQIDITLFYVGINARIHLWTKDTFKKQSLVRVFNIDPDVDNPESFTIYAEDLGLKQFDGVFFLDFIEDEGETQSVFVANFAKYYECLVDKVTKMEVKGCKEKVSNSDCKDCGENSSTLCDILPLLKSLKIAADFGFSKDMVKIIQVLEDYCEVCNNCPEKIHPVLPEYSYKFESNI